MEGSKAIGIGRVQVDRTVGQGSGAEAGVYQDLTVKLNIGQTTTCCKN